MLSIQLVSVLLFLGVVLVGAFVYFVFFYKVTKKGILADREVTIIHNWFPWWISIEVANGKTYAGGSLLINRKVSISFTKGDGFTMGDGDEIRASSIPCEQLFYLDGMPISSYGLLNKVITVKTIEVTTSLLKKNQINLVTK